MRRINYGDFESIAGDDGNIIGGVRLHIYKFNSDVSQVVYSDDAGRETTSNPLVSDANGNFKIAYLPDGVYRFLAVTPKGERLLERHDIVVRDAAMLGHFIEFGSFASLVSDRSLSYTADLGREVVAVGDLVRTIAGHFTYRVLDASAEFESVETAGGVKLLALPSEEGRYCLDAFGAVGDGQSDDTAAFLAFRNLALADPNNVSAELILTPGKHYTYTDNRWIQGFRRLKIFGKGAKLECMASAPIFAIDKNVFNFQAWNSELGAQERTGQDIQFQGDLINSAPKHSSSVTLKTPAAAANYTPGQHVLVYGFANQIGGQPMNARYFEYRVVDSLDTGTGEVSLTENLLYAYDETWPTLYQFDWTQDDAGPPRILALQRDNRQLTEHFEVLDVVFVRNRNATSTSRLSVTGLLFACFRNCDMSDLVETTVGSIDLGIFDNCRLGRVEADKQTTRIKFVNCQIEEITQGVGTEFISISGGKISKKIEVGSKNVRMTDTVLEELDSAGALIRVNGTNPRRVESFILDNVTAFDKNKPLHLSQLTSNLVFNAMDGANNFVLSKANWANFDHLYPGMRLFSEDAQYVARITGFQDLNATEVTMQVTWETAVPSLPVSLLSSYNHTLEVRGETQTYVQKSGETVFFKISSSSPEWGFDAPLVIGEGLIPAAVRCQVLKPMPNTGSFLWLRNTRLNQNAMTVDLSALGCRTVFPSGAVSGVLGGDTHNSAAWAFGSWSLHPRTGGQNAISGPPEDLPIFEIEVDFRTFV